MKTYRIYTENKNKDAINKIVSKSFDAFTTYVSTYDGVGFWRGTKERSLIIEVITESKNANKIKHVAQEIKKENKQEAVLIQELKTAIRFI